MLQNRVDPWGRLCAVEARGTLMGNRGILHNKKREVVRTSAHKGWVTCLLSYKNIRRPSPFSTMNNYSELFFLDEATAFSAGHRPCGDCQRKRSNEFKQAWIQANVGSPERSDVKLSEIDAALHDERTHRRDENQKMLHQLSELPFGTMIEVRGTPHLVMEDFCAPWSFTGYGEPIAIDKQMQVNVLTPLSIVKAFRAGFVPTVHSSATAPKV